MLIILGKTYNLDRKMVREKFPRKGGIEIFQEGGIPRRGGSSNKGGMQKFLLSMLQNRKISPEAGLLQKNLQ